MRKHLLFLFVFVPLLALGQEPHPILQSFNAYKQSNGVLVRWVIKGGNQCNGTKVFRASDDLVFEQINHIPGICGSFTENETYSYFDSVPHSNQYNLYKLELGFQGFSQPITIFFEDFGRSPYLILSDPAAQTTRILFSNDQKQNVSLELYDRVGKPVYSATGNDSDFEFSTAAWKPDIYIFRIFGANEIDISGKVYIGAE